VVCAGCHGSPQQPNGCSVCHTSIPPDAAFWTHAFQWKDNN
jgi:hypothetical protein